jgi:N-acetyl-gamma-glutamyl-phosphate reductase
MKVCVIGASGYTGRELVALLLSHPEVQLKRITSRALSGELLVEHMPYLRQWANNLAFTNPSITDLAEEEDIEVFFLALPHGTAANYAVPLLSAGKKVIDLSADFRIRSSTTYEEFYGAPHPAPQLLSIAQYGLPELHELSWEHSSLIASPGCYPTSAIIPLAPLLKNSLIEPNDIVINSMSGISGAGRNATEKLIYCERNENASAYGLPKHRHLSEMEEQLSQFNGSPVQLTFQPHLAPMNRGICTTISARVVAGITEDQILDCWHDQYGHKPFVSILRNGSFPEVKNVSGTNGIDISAHTDPRTGRISLCSTEDNLIKGAGGQAIQSMNLCQGFDECSGLR